MRTAIFDIEGDDLFPQVSRLWCGVIIDLDSLTARRYVEADMGQMVDDLNEYDIIVGHNIIGYDIPALEQITGKKLTSTPHDTLVGSRLRYPDLMLHDKEFYPLLSKKGSHSLGAWGERLGFPKGDYDDWSKFTEEMMEYCQRDCGVTMVLYNHLKVHEYQPWRKAYKLELRFAQFCQRIEQVGFAFDVKAAEALAVEIREEMEQCKQLIDEVFPPTVTRMKTPAWWLMTHKDGAHEPVKGATKTALTKVRTKEWGCPPRDVQVQPGPPKENVTRFNPGSRQQVAAALKEKYGWESWKKTDKGNPSIDDEVLEGLDWPEAKAIRTYLMLNKHLGMLAEGDNAYLKMQDGGIIKHRVNTIGCVTGRVAHSKPNLGQIPVRSELGTKMRGLFGPQNDWVQVGADLSGIEARLLAHYLHPFDKGEFADTVLNGDIHEVNREAAGLDTRDQAKTFFYALMYGAGAGKIGSIVGGGFKDGKRLIMRYMDRMPAMLSLTQRLQHHAGQTQTIKALDGRFLPVRSEHVCLNVLLQGGGAIVAKAWANIMWKTLLREKILWEPLAFVHDEVQSMCLMENVEEVEEIMVESATVAGSFYNLRVPITAEACHGDNWASTH